MATTRGKGRAAGSVAEPPSNGTGPNGGDGPRHVLIADDDAAIRELLMEFLGGEGFQVSPAQTGAEVLAAVPSAAYDLILMDIRLPDTTGLDVLKQLNNKKVEVPIILMTAHGSSNIAIQATQLGAYDYITKPFELDDVLLTIKRYFERQRLASEVRSLKSRLEGRDPSERIIGNSAAMQQIYRMIGLCAGTEATVLITGETGTGKELIAQVIHNNSQFRAGKLVKVNCAALPETLLESELFGHEKGSFTGAVEQRKGRFEMAHKGTIFLDEIGEMSLNIQRKLLRVLQEREFERVGGTMTIRVDTRVIAATNKRLEEEVAAGRFRDDLYYRLNVIRINTPPLREREEDIPLLVEHFLDKHRYREGAPPARISAEAMAALEGYAWPGNVRELENTVERAVILAQGGVITSHHLVFSDSPERRFLDLARLIRERSSLAHIVAEAERLALLEALSQAQGDRGEAARLLNLDRATLIAKLRDYDLGG